MKINDSRSHRRLYTRSCCRRNTFFMALFCRQKRIPEKGRPKLNSLTKASKSFVRHYKYCNYECYERLTASTEHKLFCWPCLLFNPSKGTWNDRPMDFICKWYIYKYNKCFIIWWVLYHCYGGARGGLIILWCGVWMSSVCTVSSDVNVHSDPCIDWLHLPTM